MFITWSTSSLNACISEVNSILEYSRKFVPWLAVVVDTIVSLLKTKTHISNDCPLTVIDCMLSHVGCKLRKDMVQHLTENAAMHMSLLAKSYKEVVSQLVENKQLKHQVDKLMQDLRLQRICTPICPVEFTMTNIEQHQTDDDEWLSPSFYTHLEGYKMQVYFAANSYDEYEDTHIAVGIQLMKGEYDDQLQWPFRGKLLSG